MFKGSTPHVRGPHFYLHAKFGEAVSGKDMPPKLNLKQRPLAAEFYFHTEMFACDTQTDGQPDNTDNYYSCGRPVSNARWPPSAILYF